MCASTNELRHTVYCIARWTPPARYKYTHLPFTRTYVSSARPPANCR
jgi:hypothetical protein